MMFAGIDFGSKRAGSTSICIGDEAGNVNNLLISARGKDADAFLLKQIGDYKLSHIFIDSPLSLPGIYRGLKAYDDYFYRFCDRETGAMSPMFLGGLTARAIKLKDHWEEAGIAVYEVWPSMMALEMGLNRDVYKSTKERILPAWQVVLDSGYVKWSRKPESWHELDAVLAYISGLRIHKGIAKAYGRKEEGLIYV